MPKFPHLLSAVVFVIMLHGLINILNRFLNAFLFEEDCEQYGTKLFSCAMLEFLILHWLLTNKPKPFAYKYGLLLIQAELFLQLMHLMYKCQLFNMTIGDVLPFLDKTAVGSLNLFKIVAVLVMVYMLARFVMTNWDAKSGGDSSDSGSVDCDLKEDNRTIQDIYQGLPYGNISSCCSSNTQRTSSNNCRTSYQAPTPYRR